MPSKGFSRRDLLKIGAAAGAAELAATLLPGCGALKNGASPVTPTTACSTLTAIDHVVIFIQENRSFDHYFGSYRGVTWILGPERGVPSTGPCKHREFTSRRIAAIPSRYVADELSVHPRHHP
jgi:phospholipase C